MRVKPSVAKVIPAADSNATGSISATAAATTVTL
jgi:hypothetical protein